MENYSANLQSGVASLAKPETTMDYLQLVEVTRAQKRCLKYTSKALELAPDN